MDNIVATFQDMLRPYQDQLLSLVSPGELIRAAPRPESQQGVDRPSVLQSSCPSCGEELVSIAQFWAHGRLWSLGFCQDWSSHTDATVAFLSSAGSEHGLVDGQAVKGNSSWDRVAIQMLPNSQDPVLRKHPAIVDLGLVEEDSDEFFEALASLTGATLPGTVQAQRALGLIGNSWSTLGGAEMPVQWDHSQEVCPVCQKRLSLLGQFGPEIGFNYGDAGVAFVFVCPDHPDQTLVDCQMH